MSKRRKQFWATWCEPCIGEFPHFQKAYEKYKDEVQFIMIEISGGNTEEKRKSWKA